MVKVKDIMIERPAVISPEHTLYEALGMMNQKHIRSLPVLKNDKVVGIITRYDLKKHPFRNYASITVKEAMSSNPKIIPESMDASEALQVMNLLHCGSLIVADENKRLLGFLARSDLEGRNSRRRNYNSGSIEHSEWPSSKKSENQKWVCEICDSEFDEKEEAESHEKKCKKVYLG